MREEEKVVLNSRLQYFIEEVFPLDLLPWLTCLTTSDKQQIEADKRNHGDRQATDTLVDRLMRRKDGFQQFVNSLRENGSEHVAMLLDPEMKVVNPNKQFQEDDNATLDLISGVVVHMRFRGRLYDECENVFHEAEAAIAEEYGEASSPQAIRLRTELNQVLPRGSVFYKTKKGSVVCVFRVCRVSAAQELWQMYLKGTLHSKILEFMLTDKLRDKLQGKMIDRGRSKDADSSSKEKPAVKLELAMLPEKYEETISNLQAIESGQNPERMDRSSGQTAIKGCQGTDATQTESLSALVIPPVYLDNDQSDEAHQLVLREYQKELAAPALRGQNIIICAPANSGKTYVAIHIARNHLEKYSMAGDEGQGAESLKKNPKILFIVPTLSLVFQQKERFEHYLKDKYSVVDICGGNAVEMPLEFLLENNDVVVLTAQILVNALKKKKVKLTEISMLLFDECHHTNKNHSYNKIMEIYMAMKMQPGMQPETLPQVIGLTASLGVGQSKTLLKAKEHILCLCSNLNAELISTVKENAEELRKNVNLPDRKLHSVSKPKGCRFEQVIGKVMELIEKKAGTSSGKPPQWRIGQDYRQWVETLYQDAVADGNRYLVTYAEQLREYHIALTVNDTTRMKDATRRLEDYFEKRLDETKFTDIDKKLKGLYMQAKATLKKYVDEKGEPSNPLLDKLKELISSYHSPAKQDRNCGNSTRKKDPSDSNNVCPAKEAANSGKKVGEDEVPRKDETNMIKETEDREKEACEKSTEATELAVKECSNPGDKKALGDTHLQVKTDDQPHRKVEFSSGKKLDVSPNLVDSDSSNGSSLMSLNIQSQNQEDTDKEKKNTSDTDEEFKCVDKGQNKDIYKDEDKIDAETKETEQEDTDRDKNPKGILFTQTRESTRLLEEWVLEDKDLTELGLKPLQLLGTGDREEGMTQNEREAVINKFKSGEANLIIATTVAEEGLDIKECNYVIRYNVTGNEISSVQSRGRVRADMGEYNVLATASSGVLKREWLNQFKEILMAEALAEIQSLPPSHFKQKINNLQERAASKRRIRDGGMKFDDSLFDPDDISFHCRKCNEFVCQAHEVRRIRESYHVITSREFLEKATEKPHPNPKTIDGVTKTGKLHCAKCDEDWGITVHVDGIELPCIKVCSFVLRMEGDKGRGKMYKKWVLCPFRVKEVEISDIVVAKGSLNGEDDGDEWEMDFD